MGRPTHDSGEWLPAGSLDGELGRMFERTYEELRRIAYRRRLAGADVDSTQAAALVHETYLRFRLRFRTLSAETLQDRKVFVRIAGLMMKSVAIDRWRRLRAARRGGGCLQPLPEREIAAPATRHIGAAELLALDEALTRLRGSHPELFEMLQQRFFQGRSVDECARLLGIDRREARRRRRLAIDWLRRAFRP